MIPLFFLFFLQPFFLFGARTLEGSCCSDTKKLGRGNPRRLLGPHRPPRHPQPPPSCTRNLYLKDHRQGRQKYHIQFLIFPIFHVFFFFPCTVKKSYIVLLCDFSEFFYSERSILNKNCNLSWNKQKISFLTFTRWKLKGNISNSIFIIIAGL